MRKKHFIALLFTFILIFGGVSYAKVTTLWRVTSTTYVTSEHADDYLADTYYGTASVRGADRVKKNNMIYYYNWTRIVYDVQGEIYSTTAPSYGKDHPNQVIRTITVKDKWNDGPKTIAYAEASKSTLGSYFNSDGVSRMLNESESIDFVELLDGQTVIEDVEILNEGKDRLNIN